MCAPFVSSYEPAPSLARHVVLSHTRGLDPEVSDVPVGDQAASQERLAFALDCHAAFLPGYSQVDLPVGAAAGKIGFEQVPVIIITLVAPVIANFFIWITYSVLWGVTQQYGLIHPRISKLSYPH